MTSAPMTLCINEALPIEILGVIFEEHARLEWRAPVNDGRVCRLWRQIILVCPRAWAHLELTRMREPTRLVLRRWLDRSGTTPLHVRVDDYIPNVDELLDRHHGRIESLIMHRASYSMFENRSFPILQLFTVDNWHISETHGRQWGAMPMLQSLRTCFIDTGRLPSSSFPPLRTLALYKVDACDCLLQKSHNSLTSLMLDNLSLRDTSEALDFPSLTFLSLYAVENLKHRMNVPALIAYHEGGGTEEAEFSTPPPLLAEYGIFQSRIPPPGLLSNVMELDQCYPNLQRLSIRAYPSVVMSFLHSFVNQPTAVPMLQILAVGTSNSGVKYSRKDEDNIIYDIVVRNITRKVKITVHFEGSGKFKVPLFFGAVRTQIRNVEVS